MLSPAPLPKNPETALKFPPVIFPFTLRVDSVPKLVIFGCALVVTIPAVLAKNAVFALRFGTSVVELTTRGAVPVATLDINCGAIIFADATT